MAKTKISEFSTTAGNNTDINSINIAEGCAPSGINDAIRELMRQLKEFQTGGAGDSVNSGGDFSVATNKFTVASASGNTAVAGTLAVTGVATLTAQPILSSLTASKAVFTDASKGLVSNDVTGTGNVVMSNSPTLVTPALGTPSSGVVTNLTGTASININGTVGATTPSTGAFTTLLSTGNTTLGDADTDTLTFNASFVTGTTLKSAKLDTNTLALAAYDVDGTAYTNLVTLTAGNSPTLALTSTGVGTINNMSIGATTASTGAFTTLSASGNVTLSGGTANGVLYLNGSKVATAGSALVFDGTNLGIGVASPTLRIQAAVSGATTTFDGLNVTNGTAQFRLGTTGASYSYAGAGANETWLYSAGTTPLTLGPDGNAPIKFVSNGSEAMRLTSTGLGIGTSSPAARLDLNASGSNAQMAVQNWPMMRVVGTTLDIGGYNASQWTQTRLYTNGAIAATFDSSGNLGIGTSSPATKLDIVGTFTARASTAGSNQDATVLRAVNSDNSAFANAIYNANSHRWGYSGSTEGMRLDSSGNLLVGTTSATGRSGVSAQEAVVAAAGKDTSYLLQESNSYFALASHVNTTSGTRYHIGFGDGTTWTERGTISTNGTSTTYSTSSDYRLKDNQQPLTGSGAFIDALKPKTWNWKADGSRGVGFIAHEVQEVSPGSVVGEKDGERMQAMEYGSAEFIANIIAELQSLRARVAQLESK